MTIHKQKATIKILDEVHAAIIGVYQEHTEWLQRRFARKVPNYYFHPAYRLGQWSGDIQYFHKTGKTYVYLLDEIIPFLQKFGYNLELIDDRELGIEVDTINDQHFAHIPNPETEEPFILRYYQVDAVNALIENNGGIVIAGTGAGKTLMNAVLCDVYGKRGLKTLTIVPSQDLIEQTKTDFILWGLDTGEYSGDLKDTNHTHVVSTWQALQNNTKVMGEFQVVVVDEAHGLKGQVLTKLLNEAGKHIQYRFGLTGTLPKAETDAMSVHIAVGKVVYEIPAHKLQEQNFLAKLHIDIWQLDENFKHEYQQFIKHNPSLDKTPTYKQFKDSYFPEWTQEKGYLQSYNERLDWIVHLIEVKRDAKKGNVFCLVDGIRFGKKLAKLIENAVFVYGKDKKKARKEIYQLFKDNDNLVVIASVQIASTGLNIKRIFNLMFIDVGKSFVRVIQTIGRGLRKAPDKDFVSVSDICSDLKYSKRHLRERTKYYREAHYPYKKHVVKYDE